MVICLVLLVLLIVIIFIVLCVWYKKCVNLRNICKLLCKKNDEKGFLLVEEIILK